MRSGDTTVNERQGNAGRDAGRRPSGASAPGGAGSRLSIGALARATGIPVETLRTWEARYGFPIPERKPSGHRVYPPHVVARLRRIVEALTLGHRAAEVVPASDEELTALLRTRPWVRPAGAADDDTDRSADAAEDLGEILQAVRAFDAARLRTLLESDWARLGLQDFVSRRVGPLLSAVGEAWRSGDLQIRHEHFLSEHVSDLLRAIRVPHETRADGPLVVFATLAGEAHGLGLQMAASVAAAAGCRVLLLGTDLPVQQIAEVVRDSEARAVALSVSSSSDAALVSRQCAELRAHLPAGVDLVAGGRGAIGVTSPDVQVLDSFDRLRSYCERLRD